MAGWLYSILSACFLDTKTVRIKSVFSIVAMIANSSFNPDTFRQPKLSNDEMKEGTRIGIDTWADTSCAGRHAYVEEFVLGKFVNASGFTSQLGTIKSLPIAHVLYAYDDENGKTIILESNNAIYLGEMMEDSLMNPIQAEEEGVQVDTCPSYYYPNDNHAQTVTFADRTIIPVRYHGVLPYIPVRRPTPQEIQYCCRLSLSSRYDWNPFVKDGHFSHALGKFDTNGIVQAIEESDPVACNLMSTNIHSAISTAPLVMLTDAADGYHVIGSMKTTDKKDSISAEDLSKKLHIGLHTALRTLKATTHQFIRTTGMLAKRFRTDKAQLRYKQLSRIFGSFYCDYLKSSVKSIRGFKGGVLYTNKLKFYKFFPCESEKGEETGRSLRYFVEFVGLPYSLHSDNHKNFKEGFFCRLARKFGVSQTFTEPHSPWQNRAEPAIGELKRYARKLMMATNTPIRLWCFCYEYSANLLSILANGRYDLQGRTPYEAVLHYTPDISEYVSFAWFQWCWYYDEITNTKQLCRWLGPAHHVGQSFCSYIIKPDGEFLARSSVVPILDEDLLTDDMKNNMRKFMDNLESKVGNSKEPIYQEDAPNRIYYDSFDDLYDDDDCALPYGEEYPDIFQMRLMKHILRLLMSTLEPSLSFLIKRDMASWLKSRNANLTIMVILLAPRIRILFWTHVSINWNFLMEE